MCPCVMCNERSKSFRYSRYEPLPVHTHTRVSPDTLFHTHTNTHTFAHAHTRTPRTQTRTDTHTPAVSHIVSFTFFPSTSIDFTLKSTPMVAGWSAAKESSVKRSNMLDLPTPLFVTRSGVSARPCVFTALPQAPFAHACVFVSLCESALHSSAGSCWASAE